MSDRATLVAGIGGCLLLAGLATLFVVAPTHTTEIERGVPSEQAMADASENYAANEIDVIPFAALSPTEQRAVAGGIDAPGDRDTDRGASGAGPTFEYRNDVIQQYFVGYENRVYLVRRGSPSSISCSQSVSAASDSLSRRSGSGRGAGGASETRTPNHRRDTGHSGPV